MPKVIHEIICVSEDTLQDTDVESIAEIVESELRNPRMYGNSTVAIDSVTIQIGNGVQIDFHGRDDFIKKCHRLFH